ncbi:MAG: SAM-dependent methyltransferase, partial [Methylocystis sp.]|nr:SAM-dependent methyltransferase [Methylocystis sp.]
MTALRDEIASIIAQHGPITLEHYMSLCLSHPTLGYYMTRDPFGPSGDFITAPDISQMFGELLGLWAIEAWRAAGAPSPVRLVELGPGRGTLMADVLRVAPVSAPFAQAIDVHLVETSPALESVQRRMLANASRPVTWSGDFKHVPHGPSIILANEFFDALPVRHFVRIDGSWRERLVGLSDDGALVFGAAQHAEPNLRVDAPEGAIVEIGAVALRLMTDIARRIVKERGALLVVDYGYLETSLG